MQACYIREIYARRGFEAAFSAAKASQQKDLLLEVMKCSFEETGVAKPVRVVMKGRASKKAAKAGFVEGATFSELAEVKTALAARTLSPAVQRPASNSNALFAVSRLTPAETARRVAALRLAAA